MSNDNEFQREVKKRVSDLEKIAKEISEQIELLKLSLANPSPKKLETVSAEAPSRDEVALPNCLHYFGYLRFIPRNGSIPDECLTCQKVIECLKHTE